MSYGVYQNLKNREYGYTNQWTPATYPLISIPDSTIDRLVCCRQDEHHIEAEEFGEATPPLICRFSQVDPFVLAVADEDGGVIILNTLRQGIKAVEQDWLAHKNAIFDIDWMPNENKLLTASGDQTVVLWDVKTEEKLAVFKGHTSSIKTARFGHENKCIFATGARDGHIMVFDTRVRQKDGFTHSVNSIRNAHQCKLTGPASKKKANYQVTAQSVTAVIFQDDNTLISTGSVDGTIRVWDLRKTYSILKSDAVPKHTFNYSGTSIRSHGFSSLVLDSTKTRLFASCMDNTIYQYNTATYSTHPVAKYKGHKNGTFYIKAALSLDDQFIISGSTDNAAYIWRVSQPTATPWMLKGHTSEVSAVDWCKTDIGGVVTISDDTTIKIWRLLHRDLFKETTQVDDATNSMKARPLIPLTPKKGSVLPQSPVKRSSFLSQNIATLPATRLSSSESADDSSSSIARWFINRSKSGEQSPMKKTPRKLLITPKKQKYVDTACSIVADPSVGQNSVANVVKRKLYEQQSPPANADTKRQRLDDSYFSGHIHDENSAEGFLVQEKESRNIVCGTPDKPENVRNYVTPLKALRDSAQCQSPTMNMPNYVLDPHPRTPVAKADHPTTPKTPNWLSQIQQQVKHSASKTQSEAADDSQDTKTKRTPTSRSKQNSKKLKRSIMKYFSPSAERNSSISPNRKLK